MYTVITTLKTKTAANRLARRLTEEKLAACVTVLPAVDSTFWWRGKIEHAREAILLAKTTRGKMERLMKRIGELHPYEVPELIAIPGKASKKYLYWIQESLTEKPGR